MKKLSVDPRAKALIFDLDGTLVDSMPLHYEAWKDVCAIKGLSFSEEEFYSLAGVPTDRISEILNERHGTDFEPKAVSNLKEETYLKKIDKLQPIKPVFELAKQYHGKLPMAIGTGSPGRHSWEAVRALGLDKYFDILVSKNDVKEGKPNPETFLKCAKAMDISPEYCQVFEDGDPGLQAAKTAGMIATDIREYI
ncbi:MAG: beta-phosphoglucomutase family hydrolase [Cyclobacteriaceae bacterium]|nr:beta-phosphoglucomutase family hydrolase [Cyclobacteriaceae bacterium]